MSSKTYCPGCESYTSSLTTAFETGWEPCPICGLSNSAWQEINTITRARNDDALAEKYRVLRVENDGLRRANEDLKIKLNTLRRTIREVTADAD